MTATFAPDAARDAAAELIADAAHTWLQIRLRRAHGAFAAGTKFYGVPSSKADGSFYYTNLRACSCPDYQRRGQGCKHQRAVALHVRRVRAAREQAADQAPALPALPGGVFVSADPSTAPRVLPEPTCRCGARIDWDRRMCDACRERERALLANDF
jgi:hypothetical protein